MTLERRVVNDTNDMPAEADRLLQREIRPASDMGEILFEQLGYLIQFADQEHGRLERVKAVLMEPFE